MLQEIFWKIYYLRKKQKSEITIKNFLNNLDHFSLSKEAIAVIKHSLLKTKGKRVRPVLTYLIHDILRGNNIGIDNLAILAELPHRGSLLEDDINDNAKQRDSLKPAHKLYGKEATLEACSLLYKSPLFILDSLLLEDNQKYILIDKYKCLSKRAREGQIKDVQWGKGTYIPTKVEYLQMCEKKCAAFEYAIRVGALAGKANKKQTETLILAGNKLAVSFQLIDDLISLKRGSDDFGSDISEGKKTLPVILSSNSKRFLRLQEILSMHTINMQLIDEAISILNDSGGIIKTESIAKELTNEAIFLISSIFSDDKYRKILFSIINYGIHRSQ